MKERAGIVWVKCKLSECFITNNGIRVDLIAKPLNEVSFVWVTSILAPHSLDVHCTNWAIEAKDRIDLDEVGIEDLCLIIVTAERGVRIIVRAVLS